MVCRAHTLVAWYEWSLYRRGSCAGRVARRRLSSTAAASDDEKRHRRQLACSSAALRESASLPRRRLKQWAGAAGKGLALPLSSSYRLLARRRSPTMMRTRIMATVVSHTPSMAARAPTMRAVAPRITIARSRTDEILSSARRVCFAERESRVKRLSAGDGRYPQRVVGDRRTAVAFC